MERKLTAILCADVYGYSRLMGENEEATVRTLSAHRRIIDGLIEQHHGRFVNSAGDSVLAEFASVVHAVECSIEIQNTLKVENASLPSERRMQFRIGVNLGDVVVEGEQIFGDGINVAARLESLADPGGICISDTVHAQIRNKLSLNYQDLGEQKVKNIAQPVRVFRLLLGPKVFSAKKNGFFRKHWRKSALSVATLALLAGVTILVQHLSVRTPEIAASIPPEHNWNPPLPSIPSIAVLPFTNLSGDPQQEYFSDGMTVELITDLSRLNDLFVIASTSSFAYKNKPAKVQDIGRELGVKYLLEGSVLTAKKSVRVEIQLVEARTGTNLWAGRFDRPFTDVLTVQDDIVQATVTTLNLQVGLSHKGIFTHQNTDSLEAYDDYLRAISLTLMPTKEINARARSILSKAIALDPKYADPYVLMGSTYFVDWVWQWDPDPQTLERSLKFVQKAITLDESISYAHAVLSTLLAYTQKYDAAIAEADRAIALAPNSGGNYLWVAEALNVSGKSAEALKFAQKAMRVDPINRELYLFEVGYAYLLLGRPQEAVPVIKRFLVSRPGFVGGQIILTAAYVDCGEMELAHMEAAEIIRHSPQFSLETGPFKGMSSSNSFLSSLRRAGLK